MDIDNERISISRERKPFFGLNIETGVFIALIIAGSYYISFFYLGLYYGRLGIYTSLLNFSIEETIIRGFVVLIISVMVCLLVWLG